MPAAVTRAMRKAAHLRTIRDMSQASSGALRTEVRCVCWRRIGGGGTGGVRGLLLLFVPFWLLHVVEFVETCCAWGLSVQVVGMIRMVPTAVAVPVKVILGVTVALVFQAVLLAGRAMGEGDVVVGNVVEEVDFVLLEHRDAAMEWTGASPHRS